jgi:hypothetical protein
MTTKTKKKTLRALGTRTQRHRFLTAPANQKALTARQSLRAAIDRCCVACGEAQWTNGYRAGSGKHNDAELYAKEERIWKHVSNVERRLEVCISRYATAIRKGHVR